MKYIQKYVYLKKQNKTETPHFRPRPELALRIKLIVSPTLEAAEAAVLLTVKERGLVERDARLPPSIWLPTTQIGYSQSKQEGNVLLHLSFTLSSSD